MMKLALLSLMFLLLMGIAMGEDSIMLDLPPGMSPDEAGETVQKSIEQNIETDGDLPEKTIVKPTTGPVSTFQGEGEFSHNDGVTNIETINTLETTSNENLADATNVEITKDGFGQKINNSFSSNVNHYLQKKSQEIKGL